LLTPAELDRVDQIRDQLRQAGVNLNSLLRRSYLYENGVQDRPPPADELEEVAGELRSALDRVRAWLAELP
jgi:hypothetical protein